MKRILKYLPILLVFSDATVFWIESRMTKWIVMAITIVLQR